MASEVTKNTLQKTALDLQLDELRSSLEKLVAAQTSAINKEVLRLERMLSDEKREASLLSTKLTSQLKVIELRFSSLASFSSASETDISQKYSASRLVT